MTERPEEHADLERRLAGIPPPAPLPELRARVLARVDRELATPALDRLLSRPAPWVAAAALLLAFLVGAQLLPDVPAHDAGTTARPGAARWVEYVVRLQEGRFRGG